MFQQLILGLFLLLFPLVVFPAETTYLQTLIKKAIQLRLAERDEWHALLHYKPRLFFSGFKSLVDAPEFFNSPQGKTDPQAELESTLARFFSEERDEAVEGQHPQCAFIGRYHWLKQELDFNGTQLREQPCPRFYAWLEALDPQGVTLIFPTAYLNNPASMFGHTLLRIDSQDQDEHTRLLAYTVNFAAQTNEENGLLFAIKGLLGGYPGAFSIAPYYLKVREYSDIEDRDIWEYELRFTLQEVERLLRHVWELRTAYFDYFFFDENCSYHLLSLLEVARPTLKLTDQFRWWAIPNDTVRAVAQQTGLVEKVVYRPSRGTTVRYRSAAMTSQERVQAKKLVMGELSPHGDSLHRLPAAKQAAILELASDYGNYQHLAKTEKSHEFSPSSLALLAARSQIRLPEESKKPAAVSPPAIRPDEGHKTSRLSLGYGYEDFQHFVRLAFRPAYHDLLDPEEGYTRGAQIEFLNTALRYNIDKSKVELDQLKLIDIVSLSPRDLFIKPLSWKLNFGTERQRLTAQETALVTDFNGGMGLAYEVLRETLAFGFLEGTMRFSDRLDPFYGIGFGPYIGLIRDLNHRWRIKFSARAQQFFVGDVHGTYEFDLEQRFSLSKQSALRFRISHRQEINHRFLSGDVAYQWYF